jgi:hypothetical protein
MKIMKPSNNSLRMLLIASLSINSPASASYLSHSKNATTSSAQSLKNESNPEKDENFNSVLKEKANHIKILLDKLIAARHESPIHKDTKQVSSSSQKVTLGSHRPEAPSSSSKELAADAKQADWETIPLLEDLTTQLSELIQKLEHINHQNKLKLLAAETSWQAAENPALDSKKQAWYEKFVPFKKQDPFDDIKTKSRERSQTFFEKSKTEAGDLKGRERMINVLKGYLEQIKNPHLTSEQLNTILEWFTSLINSRNSI